MSDLSRSNTRSLYDPEEWRARGWMKDALCRQVDPDMFFPEVQGQRCVAAIRVCKMCPVREECLEYALKYDEMFGIWGGFTESHRRRKDRYGNIMHRAC